MTELDFDELDNAVNSILETAEPVRPSPMVTSARPNGQKPATAPSSLARRRGKFMDIVQPSSDKPKPSAEFRPASHHVNRFSESLPTKKPISDFAVKTRTKPSRQFEAKHGMNSIMQPAGRRETSPPETAAPARSVNPPSLGGYTQKSFTPEPASDPADLKAFNMLIKEDTGRIVDEPGDTLQTTMDRPLVETPTPVEDRRQLEREAAFAAVVETDPPLVQATEPPEISAPTEANDDFDFGYEDTEDTPREEPPLNSPFLSGAKVEKRPLGKPNSAAIVNEKPESNDDLMDMTDSLPARPEDVAHIDFEAGKEPALQGKQSKDSSEPGLPPRGDIPKQYKEKQPSIDSSTGSVYDVDSYHQPLAGPGKQKSIWLWFLWIMIILLVGSLGGVVYFYFTNT